MFGLKARSFFDAFVLARNENICICELLFRYLQMIFSYTDIEKKNI